jgi:monoamine oxidase
VTAQFDCIVVGGGAAGIAAARHLHDRGRAVLLVEARDRLGGRGWTVTPEGGPPVDMGCGWLHSADRNVWARIAERDGIAIDRTMPPWGQQAGRRGFPKEEHLEFNAAREAFEARVTAEAATGRDPAAATLLEAGNRWNPLIDALNGFINGTYLDRQSTIDYDRYEDTYVNWRLPGGYGALMQHHAAGLPVRFRCAVNAIDHTGTAVRIETAQGTLTARGVIVTVPTNLLAAGAIRFPAGVDPWLHAASNLPLGLADKLFMRVGKPEALPKDGNLIGSPYTSQTGSYHLRPFGRPLIEGYFAAGLAEDLEKEGLAGFFDFAKGQLGKLLGSDIVASLTPVTATAWRADPWARGSYTYALPGHADDRRTLAQPCGERLFFAGEACSPGFFTTAHGAYESGVAAAEGVEGLLRT